MIFLFYFFDKILPFEKKNRTSLFWNKISHLQNLPFYQRVGNVHLLKICTPDIGYQEYQPDISDILNGYHDKVVQIN